MTERVLQNVQQLGKDRSVIFISHRLIEIAAVCDRATVLRNGETVGVVDVAAGSEDKIVNLMLGEGATAFAQREGGSGTTADRSQQTPRLSLLGVSAARQRIIRAVPG